MWGSWVFCLGFFGCFFNQEMARFFSYRHFIPFFYSHAGTKGNSGLPSIPVEHLNIPISLLVIMDIIVHVFQVIARITQTTT